MAKEVQVFAIDREDNHFFIKEDEIGLLKPGTEETVKELLVELGKAEKEMRVPKWFSTVVFWSFLSSIVLITCGIWKEIIGCIIFGVCLLMICIVNFIVRACLYRKMAKRVSAVATLYQGKLDEFYIMIIQDYTHSSSEPVLVLTLVPNEMVIKLNLGEDLRPQLINIVAKRDIIATVQRENQGNQPASNGFTSPLVANDENTVPRYDPLPTILYMTSSTKQQNNQGPVVQMA